MENVAIREITDCDECDLSCACDYCNHRELPFEREEERSIPKDGAVPKWCPLRVRPLLIRLKKNFCEHDYSPPGMNEPWRCKICGHEKW